MKLYADTSGRRLLQITADLLFLAWLALWVLIGNTVHDGTLELTGPGVQLQESATGMASGLRDAGSALDGVPLVGDEVASPFERAAGGADQVADAGRSQVTAVESLAFWLRVVVIAIPVTVVAVTYLPGRVRFVRQATAGARFVDSGHDLDLFALRALASQPMTVLARVSDDPAGAWRRGDPEVVRRLAEIELRDSGLRLPPAAHGGPAVT